VVGKHEGAIYAYLKQQKRTNYVSKYGIRK